MKKHKTLFFAALAALAVTLLVWPGTLTRLDKWTQDTLFQRPCALSGDVVVIGVDEKALAELGPYNTWDRGVMASALEALAADPDKLPAAVAVDTLYAGQSEPAADARLADAAAALGNVVTASAAEFGSSVTWESAGAVSVDSYAVLGYEEAYPALRDVTAQGHINAMYDLDGVMRHALLYVEPAPGERVYSMPFEAARLYLARRGETLKTPPVNERGQFYIPYAALPGDFYDNVSIADLIRGDVPADYWAGRIVFIGPYAAGLQDAYFTPMDSARQMYGVEVQANIAESLLSGSFKREVSDAPQLIVLFLVCAAAMCLFLKRSVALSGAVCAVLMAGGVGASMGLYALGYVTHPTWLAAGVLALYIASVAWNYGRAALERQRVTRTFERYVAPEIVREILKEGTDSLSLGGKLCDIAVLFVDVRGFTTMSERLPPEEVVFILNRYLTMTSACIEKNRGTLDKFVGDATMAFWGAPLPQEEPVYLAARTALDIVHGAKEVSDRLKEELGEELRVGVGVHFGPAVVGNMGSERHMDYTAIGDTVNTAARLEANAPGGTVYISRAVADALGPRAKCSSLGGSVKLKGKAEGFEVLTLDALD